MPGYNKTLFIILTALFVLAYPVFSLNMSEMPEVQTKIREPQERAISLMLPFLQTDSYWTFMSKEDFLSGKLLLRIIRNEKAEEIVIFENGQFSDGWGEMIKHIKPDRGEIYTGFVSSAKYLTAPDDRLELELTVIKDLPGIGPKLSGTLKSGIYKSTGTYSGLIDEYDTSVLEKLLAKSKMSSDKKQQLLDRRRSSLSNTAFMENWQQQWSLEITSQKGWLSEEQAAALIATLERIQTSNEKPESRKADSTKKEIKAALKITGVVRDDKGEPVPGAVVTIPRIFRFRESNTDKDGKFSINAKLENLRENEIPYLVIRHRRRNLAAEVKLEDETENLEIILSPGITLSGRVLNPDKNGIQNAKLEWIIWTSETGNNVKESVEIDKQGGFQINALPPGFKYSVHAEADGFGRDHVRIQTSQTPGDNYELDPIVLKVANLSLSGVVVDIDDKPVANAEVFFEGIGQPLRISTTDTNGRFTIEKVCAGTARIEANKQGKTRFSGHILTEVGAKDIKIVIKELDSSGKPVQTHSLINNALPEISDLVSDFNTEQVKDKCVLVCFWDYQQRPSRNCVLQLAGKSQQLKEKDIAVVVIHASKIEQTILDEWIAENQISFTVGMIRADEQKTRRNWGVKSLPWLILTDKQHIVTAEGFGLAELDKKLDQNTSNSGN